MKRGSSIYLSNQGHLYDNLKPCRITYTILYNIAIIFFNFIAPVIFVTWFFRELGIVAGIILLLLLIVLWTY